MPVLLGYWNLRGLAQSIRYLLNHVEEDYKENRIEYTEDKKNWLMLKGELGLDFPNLPYMIDGDVKITQSLAIMRYLAQKHGLTGEDASESAVLDMVEQQIQDLLTGFIRLCYDPNFLQLVEQYLCSLADKLLAFEKFLNGKKYLLGDKLTYADFYLFETLEHHEFLKGSCFKEYPVLIEYLQRIRELPSMQKYLRSESYIKWPIYSSLAQFGGKGEYPLIE